MNDIIEKYYISWKIPIIAGKISPYKYSKMRRGKGYIKKFEENGAEIELYRKTIQLSFYVESVDPFLAFLEMNSRMHNLRLVLEKRYDCRLGEIILGKTNIPKEIVCILDIHQKKFSKDIDKLAIYD